MKTALITGANQGVGYGFVSKLLGEGWRVFATTRKSIENLPALQNLEWMSLELTDDESIQKAFSLVAGKTDRIDLIVNNAGVNKDTATQNQKEKVSTLQDLDRNMLLTMFNINAIAPLLIVKQFLPLLQGNPSFIINISSIRASFGNKNKLGNYGYRASKIALNMFTFCSLKDLPENVKTFAVHPGIVKSQMNPTGEGDPENHAEKILNIVENWNDEWNGRFMNFDGTMYPIDEG
ncbi:MAG: SDR family NAD(P)-dependent oxidoreductase [Patescibacteria group bacterium]|nr:MAG: SDR family NAD(P)-dependent oxidoreductase [Patescibacteria group bacterium]